MKRVSKFSVILLVLALGTVWAQDERKTDAEIRQILINESIANTQAVALVHIAGIEQEDVAEAEALIVGLAVLPLFAIQEM